MDLQEALGKVTDPEVRKFFETMISNQNSHITKLEQQLRERPAAGAGAPEDVTKDYILRKMREEVVQKATDLIVGIVGQPIFNAVKPDFDAFLDKNLKPENTKIEYVVDAFNLVYGRCLTKKDHPVHQVGKTANPSGTPAPQAGSNGQQVAAVQNIIAGQPQVMSGDDQSAGQGVPGTQGVPVKDTRDAFSKFRERLSGSGGNKFQ